MNDIRLLTVNEAAKEMGVSATMLRPLVGTPDGPRTVQWGNEKRIPVWELRRWQELQVSALDRKLDDLLKSSGIKTRIIVVKRGKKL